MARLIITTEEELQHLHLLDTIKELFPELKIEVMPDPKHLVSIRPHVKSPLAPTRKSMLCEVSAI